MAYAAIIARVKVSPHPDPEVHSLAVGTVLGNTLIVGKDTPDGALGVFFPADGQLSPEFAKANNLIRVTDSAGHRIGGGLFDENRRVRVAKIRGVKSEGFWCELASLEFVAKPSDYFDLVEGFEFDTLNGVPICNKYITAATRQAMAKEAKDEKKGKVKETKSSKMFPKHFDTAQFLQNAWRLKEGDIVTLTEKLHGTSQRLCHAQQPTLLKTLYGRFLTFLSVFFGKPHWRKYLPQWKYLVGTRNVTLNEEEVKGSWYGKEGFRFTVIKHLMPELLTDKTVQPGKLNKGEMLYFEVVGWTENGRAIMEPYKLKEKALKKRFGDHMHFSYGCEAPECNDPTHGGKPSTDMYVYRITQVNEDGQEVDLPWEAVKQRCELLNVKYVPELCPRFIYDGNLEALTERIKELTEDKASLLDQKHFMEGACVRVEAYPRPLVMKYKTFAFRLGESEQKDTGVADTEEAA